jgi:uncharacterized SAM-binding protein YcdF (DUF218 family)
MAKNLAVVKRMSEFISDRPPKKFWGVLVRKERWGFSWRGWLGLVVLSLGLGFGLLLNLHAFLAMNQPLPTNVLVVEGWVHDYGVEGAVRAFKTGQYERVFTTGGPVEGYGPTSSLYDTDAYQSARRLRKAGIPEAVVQSVPSLFVGRDRTYNSALALRAWFQEHNLTVSQFNVLTEDCHARRTRLLFQEAFGSAVQVGIIAVPNPDYDANHWWRSSDGVREVIDESVAYVYAKFFFWPSK